MDSYYVILRNGKMIDYQLKGNPVNASKDDTVTEIKFNPNLTKLSLDENNKRILQLVLNYLLTNIIFKYADKVNNGELDYDKFIKHIENSLDFKLLNE